MRVSGFTFVRNAVDFDYPVVESVKSALPIVDEYIIVVGDSADATIELVESIASPKVRTVRSLWDPDLRTGGRVLARQADIALSHCRGDWGLYLQADEVLHEDDLPAVEAALAAADADPRVEGLLFDFVHFYGNYNTIGLGRKWYRQEVRAVRLGIGVAAWRDAQGFRLGGRKLRVVHSGARVFHYGWVRDPRKMKAKIVEMARFWHDDETVRERYCPGGPAFTFDTGGRLGTFTGTHPAVMAERIAATRAWQSQPRVSPGGVSLRHAVLDWMERRLGWSPGAYRNYRLIRRSRPGRTVRRAAREDP